jgi:hypothetical protein
MMFSGQIAMHDAGGVCLGQAVRRLRQAQQRLGWSSPDGSSASASRRCQLMAMK